MEGRARVISDPDGDSRVEVRNRADGEMAFNVDAGRVNIVNQGTVGDSNLTADSLRFVNLSDTGDLRLVSNSDFVLLNGSDATIGDVNFAGAADVRVLNTGEATCLRLFGTGDMVVGNEGTVGILFTGGGDDTVVNKGSAGRVLLGRGDDRFDGISGERVIVVAGEGDDFVRGSEFRDNISGGLGNDFITAKGGNDFITAGGEGNTIAAGNGNDRVFADGLVIGGNGNDTLTGAGRLEGRDGHDTIVISRVSEAARTSEIDGFAFGGDGNDVISAGRSSPQNDGDFSASGSVLDGGAGDDTLIAGSAVSVTHVGGDGADIFGVDRDTREGATFIFVDWGMADIQDFEDGVDRFDFGGRGPFDARGFDDFDFVQSGDDVFVQASEMVGSFGMLSQTNPVIAIIRDTDIALIDASDFI